MGRPGRLALLSTALVCIRYFCRLRRRRRDQLLRATFHIPATSILPGALSLHEQPASRHIAGMAPIGLGLVAIDGRIAGLLRAAK